VADWWASLGSAGEVEVVDQVDPGAIDRILATGDGAPLRLSTFTLGGAEVQVVVEQGRIAAYDGSGTVIAALDLPPGGGVALGRALTLTLREDADRGSRLHGPKREWVGTDGLHTWVWDTRKATTYHPRLLVDGLVRVSVESEQVSDEDRERLVKRRLSHRWTPSARGLDVVLHVLFVHADLRQALHGRIGRGLRTAFSLAGLVLDAGDEDGEVTSRARHRVSRSPAGGPSAGPDDPSSAH
jgi:hypothetical protein